MSSGSQPISQSFQIPGAGYGYTGHVIDDTLQSSEWTLAEGIIDISTSVRPFQALLEQMESNIVKALRYSPAEATLMYRSIHFSTQIQEVHGFLPLTGLNPDDYLGKIHAGGQTALYHSWKNGIESLLDYARRMAQPPHRFFSNGIIYGVTDGQHYLDYDPNPVKMEDVRKSLADAIIAETLESLMTVLIGINDDPGIQKALREFSDFCGFTQYIAAKDATPETLAKITNFISKSVVSQSQARGSGGPSQPQPNPMGSQSLTI